MRGDSSTSARTPTRPAATLGEQVFLLDLSQHAQDCRASFEPRTFSALDAYDETGGSVGQRPARPSRNAALGAPCWYSASWLFTRDLLVPPGALTEDGLLACCQGALNSKTSGGFWTAFTRSVLVGASGQFQGRIVEGSTILTQQRPVGGCARPPIPRVFVPARRRPHRRCCSCARAGARPLPAEEEPRTREASGRPPSATTRRATHGVTHVDVRRCHPRT